MRSNFRRGAVALSALAFLVFSPLAAVPCQAQFSLGTAANYGLVIEGTNHNFQLSSDSGITGNVGIGGVPEQEGIQLSSGTITGNLDFAGTAPAGSPYGGTITGSVNSNVSAVTSAVNTVNSLSTTYAAFTTAQSLVISGSGQMIAASGGTLESTGVYVYNVAAGAFNTNGGITISGTSSQWVVININNGTSNETVSDNITLTGGIASDQVLFNFTGTGGSLMSGGHGTAFGDYLAPHLTININSESFDGRIFGGDTADTACFRPLSTTRCRGLHHLAPRRPSPRPVLSRHS